MAALQRILYVEDDADIRMVAQLSLETVGGFDLELCASGAEALDRAADFKPDLLLLDMMMPDMDGAATLARLRQEPGLDRTPAMFLTARAQEVSEQNRECEWVIGLIGKPFDPMTLPDQITEVWDRWHGQ